MDILAAEYTSVYVKGLNEPYTPEKPKDWV